MTGSRVHKYGRLAHYALGQRRSLAAILALTVIVSFAAALEPLPMKLLVDNALGGAALPGWLATAMRAVGVAPRPWPLVAVAALAALLILALIALLDAGLTWLWASAGQRMVVQLTADLFSRLQRLSLQFHRTRPLGDSLDRLTSDTWCVYSFTSTLLVTPLQQVVTFASVGFIAWQLDSRLATICLSMAPPLGLTSWWFGRRLKRRARRTREARARLVSFVQQTLSMIPLVQAFCAEARNRRKFQALADDAVRVGQKAALLTGSYGMVNGTIVTLGTAIVLCAGGMRVMAGTLPLGTLLVFLAYTRSLQGAVEGLLRIYSNLKPVEASMDRVAEVLWAEELVPEAPDAQPLPAGAPRERGRLRFEHVTYGYEPGRPVLHDITLEVRPGEMVALVGHTGAGKSTLVSMLPRFHDPCEGRVLFDGMDLRRLQLKSLRSEIAFVLQDSLLLPISVADNIAYGRPEASREEIVAAATAANAHDFIERLPDGYGTVLAENGATLSGGERQRLSIARALLRNSPVLILDEPTSALDSRSEAALLEALERLMAGRTTLVIAHRLSTVRKADRIVALERGRIVETGTHEELMEARGTYYRFFTLQSLDLKGEVA